MRFQLFGFDIVPSDNFYGFWFLDIRNWHRENTRCLFRIYYIEDEWLLDILFMRII